MGKRFNQWLRMAANRGISVGTAAQAAQNLMGSMPPSPEEQKQQAEQQKDQAQLALKGEELNIRKARFMQGVKESEKQNARKDAESKAKIVEVASKVARQEKKRD